jgi:carbon storage regulator
MLVLTRKKDESIIINDNIEVTIVEASGGQVKIGIDAPRSIDIYRKEVYEEIETANKEAATQKIGSLDELLKKLGIRGQK